MDSADIQQKLPITDARKQMLHTSANPKAAIINIGIEEVQVTIEQVRRQTQAPFFQGATKHDKYRSHPANAANSQKSRLPAYCCFIWVRIIR